jgi:hypothetical protein
VETTASNVPGRKGEPAGIAPHPGHPLAAGGRLGQHPGRQVATGHPAGSQFPVESVGEDAGAAAHVEDGAGPPGPQFGQRPVLHGGVQRPLHPAGVVEVGDPVEDAEDVDIRHPASLVHGSLSGR